MRPFAFAIVAVLMIAAGGRAGEGTKNAPLKKVAAKSSYFNPKEITIDKKAPWKKDAQSTNQKVNEPLRILGEKDIAVGKIRRIIPELGLVEIETPNGVAAAYLQFKYIPIRRVSNSESGLKQSEAKAKSSKFTPKKTAEAGSTGGAGAGEIKFNEFAIRKEVDPTIVPGTLAELEKLKGFKVMVVTEPNTPMLFHALVSNEQ